MKPIAVLAAVIPMLCMSSSGAWAQGDGGVVLDKRLEESAGREPGAARDTGARITLSTGAEYSTGDYGDVVDTDILYVPLTLKYDAERFIARVTLPYIRIQGPGDVVGGTQGPIITGGGMQSLATETESGVGDVIGSLTFVVNPNSEQLPILELTGKVKLPTADEDKGLGTGETDYTAQIDLSQTFGRITPFLTIGNRWLGDSSELDLDDTMFGSVGFSVALTRGVQVGASYDYREASTSRSEDARELVAFGSYRFNRSWKLSPYVVFGTSDASPDYAAGFSISYRIQ